MLSQAVLASYMKPEEDGIHRGQLTVTGISPCPRATYIKYKHLNDDVRTPSDYLRMKNGKWQELECVEDLRHAGFPLRFTGNSQITVHVGRARISGRPDGLIEVNGKEHVLSIKARSLNVFSKFVRKGIDAEPRTMCQEQMYLASPRLQDYDGTWLYVKHKDSCNPHDIFIERNDAYAKPIVEATDEIVLGDWEPSRPSEPIPLCSECRNKLFCWKDDFLDTSGIQTITLPEAIAIWTEGRFHLEVGKQMDEEARNVFREHLKDNDVLYVNDQTTLLEVKRIVQHRVGISEERFVEKYGAAALADVMVETLVEQMRVRRKD